MDLRREVLCEEKGVPQEAVVATSLVSVHLFQVSELSALEEMVVLVCGPSHAVEVGQAPGHFPVAQVLESPLLVSTRLAPREFVGLNRPNCQKVI